MGSRSGNPLWKNGNTGGTPINANALNNIENALDTAIYPDNDGLLPESQVPTRLTETALLSTHVATGASQGLDATKKANARTNISAQRSDDLDVRDFGAVGDGVTDDTPAIQAAITAALASNYGGGRVKIPAGSYLTTSPITVSGDRLVIAGAGRGKTRIFNATSDMFRWAATRTTIRDMELASETGAGHVFLQTGATLRCTWRNLSIYQANDAKSIYSHIAGQGNHLFNRWKNCDTAHTLTATVPSFYFKALTSAGAVNANKWVDIDHVRSGNYVFWFESARDGNYVTGNLLRDIDYEVPNGGCVKILGGNRIVIDANSVYDLTYGGTTVSRDLFYVGKGTHATNPGASRAITIRDLLIADGGTTTNGHNHLTLEQRTTGAVDPVQGMRVDGLRTLSTGNCVVDYGGNSVVQSNASVTATNDMAVTRINDTGVQLGKLAGVTSESGLGLTIDPAGKLVIPSGLMVGMGRQRIQNGELTYNLNDWNDATPSILSYSSGRVRINNTSGGYLNVSAITVDSVTAGATYKIVVKLSSVTSFPANAIRFLAEGSVYTALANTTDEQVFYSTIGSTSSLTFRVNTGTDVTLDYLRVYQVTGTQPSGVAVTIEAVHAALVTLGLIRA